jgi:periplasmic protein TonB
MFEDSLVESAGRIKTRRGVTTFVSFAVQMGLLGVLVLIPLIYTEALPKQQLMTFLVAPPPPPPPPPPPAAAPPKVVKVQPEIVNNELREPTKIPKQIKMVKEEEAPPQVAGVVGGVPGGVAGGSMGGVIGGIVGSSLPPPKVAAPTKIRVSSGVVAGNKISGPNPTYPQIAKTARIQGQVVLQATISKQGTIQGLHAISGPPMLYQSAIDAVRQWRYKPYILNGEPVEVETTIDVNFTLNGG